jgi:hypothetical protein
MDGICVSLFNDQAGELNNTFIEVPDGVEVESDEIQRSLILAAQAMMADGLRAGDSIRFENSWSER